MKRISVILLYLALFLILAFPIREMAVVKICGLNIYLFEIPLAASFFIAPLTFLAKGRFNVAAFRVFKAFSPLFILVAIGVIQGAHHASVPLQTAIRGIRPIMYWCTGLICVLVGHTHFKLKSIFWLLVAGLTTQFMIGIWVFYTQPDYYILTGSRFPGQSVSLVLFVIAALLYAGTDKRYVISRKEMFLLWLSNVVLLLFVVFQQQRTTWAAAILLISWWCVTRLDSKMLIKIVILLVLAAFIFIALVSFGIIGYDLLRDLQSRLFVGTLSKQGIMDSWESSRASIYESNYRDFIANPILGHGFGHEFIFSRVFSETIEVGSTLVDNSWLTVLVLFGLVGLTCFAFFIYNCYRYLRKSLTVAGLQDKHYLYLFYYAFPFLVLVSLNVAVLYGYPDVAISSIFFSKAMSILFESKSSHLKL